MPPLLLTASLAGSVFAGKRRPRLTVRLVCHVIAKVFLLQLTEGRYEISAVLMLAVVDYRINHNLFPSSPFLLLHHPQRNTLSHCVQLDCDFHFGVHGF